MRALLALIGAAVLAVGPGAASTLAASAPFTERVSLTSAGTQSDGEAFSQASMTPDARFVAFASASPNLAPGATGGTGYFVYVRDRALGTTELVSRGADGSPPNGNSVNGFGPPVISTDGRFVAFASQASNLVLGDTNGTVDIFVYDRSTGTTRRVSVASNGTQGSGASSNPSISADGRFVVFQSQAQNLVPGGTLFVSDVYAYDVQTGTTERVSVGALGAANGSSSVTPGAVSADGRYVVFTSSATNLVPGDANGATSDVFIRDRQAGTTELASLTGTGAQPTVATINGFVSGDGRYVAYQCGGVCVPGSRLATAIYARDRSTGIVREASVSSTGEQAGSSVFIGGLSADGQHVAFATNAANLGYPPSSGAFDFYVHDVTTGTTERVSVSSAGISGNDGSIGFGQILSADGEQVLFTSTATNLVPGDTNLRRDVFIRDRGVTTPPDTSPPTIACGNTDGAWHADNVSIGCTASDSGSGLADASDAAFSLSTSVAAGAEDAHASTNTRQVCDVSGNCATAGPLSAMVDRKSPTITFVSRTPPNAAGWNNADVVVTWRCDDAGSGPAQPTVTTVVSGDGAGQNASGTCFDGVGNSAADTQFGINVDKTAPTAGIPSFSVNPKAVSESTAVSADAADTLSGVIGGELFVGADPGPGNGTALSFSGSKLTVSLAASFTPGVYSVCVRSNDLAGNWSAAQCAFLVAYDPGSGFVTGSGWVDSQPGAYRADLSLSGRAQFGFVSKYKQGATTPTGNTRFEFRIAGFDFNATSYDWLVVAGARAQFKGTGTVNGTGSYGFLITAIDGSVQGGGGIDRFRIKIWDKSAGDVVVYDNQSGAADDADPTSVVNSGSIKIHKG